MITPEEKTYWFNINIPSIIAACQRDEIERKLSKKHHSETKTQLEWYHPYS